LLPLSAPGLSSHTDRAPILAVTLSAVFAAASALTANDPPPAGDNGTLS
jgi:hypothetical protein